MSTYCVRIGEREYQVQIDGTRLLLNGEVVECDLVSLNGNGLHQLIRGTQSVEVYLRPLPNNLYEVFIGGRRIAVQVDPPHRRRAAPPPEQAGNITAPMPGMIVALQVQEGDTVVEGQVLAVQEAMKMQMQLRAPFAGRVAQVTIRIGAQVEKGALLIQVAPL